MADLRTTTCHQHGHPEFHITYDPALIPVEEDTRYFAGWLEGAVAKGECFSDGQTCQVGWMILEVRMEKGGFLTLWEPDMREMPIVWVESVSHTLVHLRLQKDVCESVLSADHISFPSLRQSAIICTRIGQARNVVMERSAPSNDRDSGWYCGCSGEEHDHNNTDHLRCVSLYEAAVKHAPQIIPYLALPEGVLVRTDDYEAAIFLDGNRLALKGGSLLAERRKKYLESDFRR